MDNRFEAVDANWAWRPFEPTSTARWNRRLAAHLYRRAAFGGSLEEIEKAVKLDPEDAVARLVETQKATEDERLASEQFAQAVLATGNSQQLAAWWIYEMLSTKQPLLERMTLFWHGHFATSADKVEDARLMLVQNQLLRREALGNFRKLAHEISRDAAMLIYLDSATNRKSHPNENYGRELMELFCLGEGNYSERDVQELARCFTGWEIKQGRYRFNRYQHDASTKTILGKTSEFHEGGAIDWIVDQENASIFIASKLFQLFICDEPSPPRTLLQPLAQMLRDSHWNVLPTIRCLLSSQLFFSEHALGRKVRSPIDLIVGLLRSLEGTGNVQQIAEDTRQLGQGLFFPPNVKGWDGGRTWINSSTILGRANSIGRLLADEKTRFGSTSVAEYLSEKLGLSSPAQILHGLEELLFAVPLKPAVRERILNLDSANSSTQTARQLLRAITVLPEFQLG